MKCGRREQSRRPHFRSGGRRLVLLRRVLLRARLRIAIFASILAPLPASALATSALGAFASVLDGRPWRPTSSHRPWCRSWQPLRRSWGLPSPTSSRPWCQPWRPFVSAFIADLGAAFLPESALPCCTACADSDAAPRTSATAANLIAFMCVSLSSIWWMPIRMGSERAGLCLRTSAMLPLRAQLSSPR